MTVHKLIKELQKLPKQLKVYQADHDHGKFETSGSINQVILINKEEMDEFENDDCDDAFKHTPQKYVVLRPH